MDSIELYFQEEYVSEKNEITEIENILIDVIDTFLICGEKGWSYELKDDPKIDNFHPVSMSGSTNTMILFLLAKLLGKANNCSPLIPKINWEVKNIIRKETSDKLLNKYDTVTNNLNNFCKETLQKNRNNVIIKSSTFGQNDPLTLSWLAELIEINQITFKDVKNSFVRISLEVIEKAFEKPYNPILKFDKRNKRKPSDHILPILRTIHLYKTLIHSDKEDDLKTCFSRDIEIGFKYKDNLKRINSHLQNSLFPNLLSRIYEQISYSTVQNSLFDTAELVLSIEGIILIDNKKKVDDKLLLKAFEIIESNQKNNLYWRPLKPFINTPTGDVLLPLSIEIANSLLRICKHLEFKKRYFFHLYYEIFQNYTKWLLSNVSQCDIENKKLRGWHSEHTQDINVIHPWETAQVYIFLMNYNSMLQDHIAYKSLKMSGLSFREFDSSKKSNSWKEWAKKEPFLYRQTIYNDIESSFILNRDSDANIKYSMLLYGPPGTGKSSLAEEIAKELNYKLITITPSDFIKHGESDIELRAKNIFKTLSEQKDCVILFDEIDRLILDRDSNSYHTQSDMFQFMTPSMLVKFKNLRDEKRSIFIIGTNYEERIDSAIKRAGRIDVKYLINPPNLAQRNRIVKELILKENLNLGGDSIIKPDSDISDDCELNKINKKTVLYTYGELKTLIKFCRFDKSVVYTDIEIFGKINEAFKSQDKPTIKLSIYSQGRLQEELTDKNASKFPFNEFLNLVYLICETEELAEFNKEIDFIKMILNFYEKGLSSSMPIDPHIIALINENVSKQIK